MESQTLLEYYHISNNRSDKGKEHNYIQKYYSDEFTPKRNDKINILEIGVRFGDSIKLWREWFTQGEVIGIDVIYTLQAQELLKNLDVNIIIDDAYSEECSNSLSIPNDFFDYIIDDGPHTLESQLRCVELYLPKLKKGGKLIIEDIENWRIDVPKLKELGEKLGIQCEGDFIPGSSKRDNALVIYTK